MTSEEVVYKGIARNVEWVRKSQNVGTESLTFRIEELDDEGNITGYIPVGVTTSAFTAGVLADGDEVEVGGVRNEDGILKPQKIVNLTTNALVYKITEMTLLGKLFVASIAAYFVTGMVLPILFFAFIFLFVCCVSAVASQFAGGPLP